MRIPLMPVCSPTVPAAPVPLTFRLRRRTVRNGSFGLGEMLMMIPVVPLARMLAKISWQSIVIDLVIVTAPKPPGSRQLISPLMNVLLMAPANVLQGAVRLHGLASSPTPETHVRVACAWAMDAKASVKIAIANAFPL